MRSKIIKRIAFICISLLACLLLLVWLIPEPDVRLQDDCATIVKRAGPPTCVVTPDRALHSSLAAGFNGYTWVAGTGANRRRTYAVDELPPNQEKILIYQYGLANTACCLVYLNREGRAVEIFHGGT